MSFLSDIHCSPAFISQPTLSRRRQDLETLFVGQQVFFFFFRPLRFSVLGKKGYAGVGSGLSNSELTWYGTMGPPMMAGLYGFSSFPKL